MVEATHDPATFAARARVPLPRLRSRWRSRPTPPPKKFRGAAPASSSTRPSPTDSQAGGHPDIKIHFKVGTKVDPVLENYPGNGNSIKEALVELPPGSSATRTRPRSARPPTSRSTIARSTLRSATSSPASNSPRAVSETRRPARASVLYARSTTSCRRRTRPGCSASKRSSSTTRPTRSSAPAPAATSGSTPSVTGISQLFTLRSFNQWMWGVPASPANDAHASTTVAGLPATTRRSRRTAPEVPFLSSPTTCAGPLESIFTQPRLRPASIDENRAVARNDRLRPARLQSLAVGVARRPTRRTRPRGSTSASTCRSRRARMLLPTLQIKAVTVTFPEGFSINPNAADGKVSCSDAAAEVRDDRRSPMSAVLEGRDPLACSARRFRRPLPGCDLPRRPAARRPLPHLPHRRRLRHPHQAPRARCGPIRRPAG